MRNNPLIIEAWQGLSQIGVVQKTYLQYMLIQAAVLLIWWPHHSLSERLHNESSPDTLLAVLIAVGATLAYYNVRKGAEEMLLAGQHSLLEWAQTSTLPLSRVLSGYLASQLLVNMHALLLSSPLLLLAYAIADDTNLIWLISLLALLLQAFFYYLLTAILYLKLGQHRQTMVLSIRAVLLLGYLALGPLLPISSHIFISVQLLNRTTTEQTQLAALDDSYSFLAFYTLLCLLLIVVLYRLLQSRRQDGLRREQAVSRKGAG